MKFSAQEGRDDDKYRKYQRVKGKYPISIENIKGSKENIREVSKISRGRMKISDRYQKYQNIINIMIYIKISKYHDIFINIVIFSISGAKGLNYSHSVLLILWEMSRCSLLLRTHCTILYRVERKILAASDKVQVLHGVMAILPCLDSLESN